MENSQYRDIEQQALQIVGTLNKLKKEIEGYRDAKVETQKSLKSLDALLDAVTDAAKQLSSAAVDLKGSDYTKLHKKLAKEADLVTTACDTLQQNLDVIPEKVEAMLAAQQARQEDAHSGFMEQLGERLAADAHARDAAQRAVDAACQNAIAKAEEFPAALASTLEAHDAKRREMDQTLLEKVEAMLAAQQAKQEDAHSGFMEQLGERLAADAHARDAAQRAVDAACQNAIAKAEEFPAALASTLEAHDTKRQEIDQTLLERVANLEQVISRIDRNTQKGFGKERG